MEFTLNNHKYRDSQWAIKAEEVYKVQKIRREMEVVEKKLMDELKALSNYESSRAGNFKLTAVERKGNIDYKSIPILKTINLEEFRSESTISWKLEMDLDIAQG